MSDKEKKEEPQKEREEKVSGEDSFSETSGEPEVEVHEGDPQKEEAGEADEAALLKEQLQAQKDKYVRLMAEFDNFKRRTAKEYEKRIKTANQKLMSDIIEIREDLDRALNTEDGVKDADSFYDGIKMIFKSFNQQLKNHGLETFGEVGDPFDPAVHDAMMKQNHDEIEKDHIVQVFSKGYKLNDVIIRHAKVIVSDGAAE
ncbi:MAG: nucleotide exchange factor GrpE [Fibrobacterota bacterium]